jgi:2-hydroxy-6-oxonona-2,4-dienedioate hydrolase
MMKNHKSINLKSVNLDNGETIGYRETGEGSRGQNILLIHGNLTSSKHWDLLMENFPNDYKIYAVDLRGFGISSYQQPIENLKDFAEDIKQLIEILNLDNLTVVGWSTGGGVGMQLAANYPQMVKNLVLLASVGIKGYPLPKLNLQGIPINGKFLVTREELLKDAVRVLPIAKAQKNRNKAFLKNLWDYLIYQQKKPDPQRYEEYLEDMLTQRNYVDVIYALSRFNISDYDNGIVAGTGEVHQITAPTLIIHGDKDAVIPVDQAREIVEVMGDQAKIQILENTGHSPLIDSLDQVILLLLDFLKMQ